MDQINVRVVLCLSTDNSLLSLLPVAGREGFVNRFFFPFCYLIELSTCVLYSLLCYLLLPSHHLVTQRQFNAPPNSLLHATFCFWQTGHFLDHCPHDEDNLWGKGHPSALCSSTASVLWPPSEERLGSPSFPQSNPCSLYICRRLMHPQARRLFSFGLL